MKPERFAELIGEIKDRFDIVEEFETEIEDIPEGVVKGIIFTSPMGKVKLELRQAPALVDKKANYSKLQGASDDIEYIYDLDQVIYSMKAYLDRNGEWEELEKADFI